MTCGALEKISMQSLLKILCVLLLMCSVAKLSEFMLRLPLLPKQVLLLLGLLIPAGFCGVLGVSCLALPCYCQHDCRSIHSCCTDLRRPCEQG